MKSTLQPEGEILSLRYSKILEYECQYVDETMLDGRYNGVCDDCEFVVNEPDINCSYCPADFDWKRPECRKCTDWVITKRYLMYADMLLRNTLGDIWNDEYSA